MYVQANLPGNSPFLSVQMAVLSSLLQMFIVLLMYNFGPTPRFNLKPLEQASIIRWDFRDSVVKVFVNRNWL